MFLFFVIKGKERTHSAAERVRSLPSRSALRSAALVPVVVDPPPLDGEGLVPDREVVGVVLRVGAGEGPVGEGYPAVLALLKETVVLGLRQGEDRLSTLDVVYRDDHERLRVGRHRVRIEVDAQTVKPEHDVVLVSLHVDPEVLLVGVDPGEHLLEEVDDLVVLLLGDAVFDLLAALVDDDECAELRVFFFYGLLRC